MGYMHNLNNTFVVSDVRFFFIIILFYLIKRDVQFRGITFISTYITQLLA